MVDVTTRLANGFVATPILVACRELGLFDYLKETPCTPSQCASALGLNSGHVAVALRILESLAWAVRQQDGRYTLTESSQVHSQIPSTAVAVLDLDLAALFGLTRKRPPDLGRYKDVYSGLVALACSGWGVEDDEVRGLCDGLLGACTVVGMHQAGLLLAFAGGNITESGERAEAAHLMEQSEEDWVVDFSGVDPIIRDAAVRWLQHEGWAEGSGAGTTQVRISLSGKFVLERALVLGTTVSYREFALPPLLVVKQPERSSLCRRRRANAPQSA